MKEWMIFRRLSVSFILNEYRVSAAVSKNHPLALISLINYLFVFIAVWYAMIWYDMLWIYDIFINIIVFHIWVDIYCIIENILFDHQRCHTQAHSNHVTISELCSIKMHFFDYRNVDDNNLRDKYICIWVSTRVH